MDQSLPSLSAGVVGSRFITQDEVDAARQRREEQWKAAYARLGQEPPPPQQDDSYDGRSLAEKLAANRIAKQEEWEEKTKLANQFRALEEDEIMFLDSLRERTEEEERQRKVLDGVEVQGFKEAVAARVSSASQSVAELVTEPPVNSAVKGDKKGKKRLLRGVIVKSGKGTAKSSKPGPSSRTNLNSKRLNAAAEQDQRNAKRQRVVTTQL